MNRRVFVLFGLSFLFVYNFKFLDLKKYKYYNKKNLVWFLDSGD